MDGLIADIASDEESEDGGSLLPPAKRRPAPVPRARANTPGRIYEATIAAAIVAAPEEEPEPPRARPTTKDGWLAELNRLVSGDDVSRLEALGVHLMSLAHRASPLPPAAAAATAAAASAVQ